MTQHQMVPMLMVMASVYYQPPYCFSLHHDPLHYSPLDGGLQLQYWQEILSYDKNDKLMRVGTLSDPEF